MYFLILVTLVINLHISVLYATCNKTFHQSMCPNSNLPRQVYQANNEQQASTLRPLSIVLDKNSTSQNERTLATNVANLRLQRSTSTTTSEATSLSTIVSPNQSHEIQVFQETSPTDSSLQQVTLENLNDFRLEYNKYKILSHLRITKDVDNLKPEIDDELRQRLSSLTAVQTRRDSEATNSRHKRSLACDQVKSDKNTCCLETFYVNFTNIGWDRWILYPAGYNANYCRGQCDLSHARYYHSTILSKYSNVISLCCSPKQMAPLKLLYIDEENKVHQKSIPDMIVEGCDCA